MPVSNSKMTDAIDLALSEIGYPDKEGLWKHVQGLGRQHQRKFSTYKFVPRGGLSSPYVKYVTDVDLIFNNPSHGRVSLEDFDVLHGLAIQVCREAGNIMSAKVCLGEEDVFDGEVNDLSIVRQYVSQGADVVVITGRYTLQSGWCVPIDFTLQHGESKISKDMRVARIRENVAEGNYAKAVQRVRAILPKGAKGQFADSWNEVGGALRFLVKQLDLVRFMPLREQAAYMYYLCLPAETSRGIWAESADLEMQQRALHLLLLGSV
ncbi:unnamed protein product [Polarella glacialis]|uniref:Uncharacterized protein n=1 Tax=Polarella glacialis TaxID=89957 RepID=A0A813I0X7_POLGL|nr:unnamed protein product [Polarella glacialis]